jgi:hypothetical protein
VSANCPSHLIAGKCQGPLVQSARVSSFCVRQFRPTGLEAPPVPPSMGAGFPVSVSEVEGLENTAMLHALEETSFVTRPLFGGY